MGAEHTTEIPVPEERRTDGAKGQRAGGAPTHPPEGGAGRRRAATWDAAVERYARLVHSIPRRFGLSREDADDVFQSTFVTAMRRSPVPPPEPRIVAFLASCAFWETRHFLRGRAPDLLDPVLAAAVADPRSRIPDAVLAEAEEMQALHDALAALPERDRMLVESLHLSVPPRSYADVAAALGVATNSIGPMLHRAVARLRDELRLRDF